MHSGILSRESMSYGHVRDPFPGEHPGATSRESPLLFVGTEPYPKRLSQQRDSENASERINFAVSTCEQLSVSNGLMSGDAHTTLDATQSVH